MNWQGQNFGPTIGAKEVASMIRKMKLAGVSVRVHHQRYVSEVAPESFSIHIMGENLESVYKAWSFAKKYQKVCGSLSNFWVNTYDGNPLEGGCRIKIPGTIAKGIPVC